MSRSGSTLVVDPALKVAFFGRTRLGLHALLATAVLALAFGAAVDEGMQVGHSPAQPVTHARDFSQHGLLSLPLAARGPVSEAVGADSAAYRIRRTRAGIIKAATPAQRFRSSFTGAGASVRAGATRVALRLRGVGYGSALTTLAPVSPKVQAHRVLYAHPGLREWYANGPLGLEQGFTITHAPVRRAAGPLTLSLALSGDAHPALVASGRSITGRLAGGGFTPGIKATFRSTPSWRTCSVRAAACCR